MSGVYQIRCLSGNRKVYIGGTTQDFTDRWRQHCSDLDNQTHSNHELQADWNVCGEQGFRFEVVERVGNIEGVPDAEQRHLDRLFASGVPAYNILKKTTFPEDKEWYEDRKMARRSGRGSFFRGFGMKPGRYETKESNIRTDWLMPILQGLACVVIMLLDLLFIGSWFFILPPELDWVLGLILFWVIWSAALIGNWIFIRLLPYSWPWKWKLRQPGFVNSRLRRKGTWIPCTVIEIGILLFMWFHVWDWWWGQCLKYPDVTIPVPSIEGVTGFFVLGLFISFIGIIGTILPPGSKYALGLTAFGGFICTISHLFSPVTVQVSHERPVVIYAIWVAWCVAWIVGTASLYYRMWLLEICDPYQPELSVLKEEQDFPIIGSHGSAEGTTSGM